MDSLAVLEPMKSESAVVESEPAVRHCDSVLCFGDSDWWYHNRGHADMQFMRRFARRTKVVYVNSLGVKTPSVREGRMFLRRIKRKIASISQFYRDGGEGFGVLSPVYVPFNGGMASSIAQSVLALQLKSLLTVLGMRRPLVWVACPTASSVLDRFTAGGVVHQLSDCYGALRGGHESGAMAERKVATRADLIICSSGRLLEHARSLYGKGDYVDHGVDYELFSAAGMAQSIPPELKEIRPPIVGFFGNMDANTVDLALLECVIRLRPQYSFVLVGDMSSEFERLRKMPNVVHIPRQPYREVARIGAAFQVCMMPWLQNQWIEHCNPVKLKEYLALGRPVVSTPFPELRRSGSLCLVATGADEFSASIDRALADDSPELQQRRRAWASQHTWDVKFSQVQELLRREGITIDERS